jgi:hypothetical protein
LTWGFFLKCSRLSKYFRKMKYVMPCHDMQPLAKLINK